MNVLLTCVGRRGYMVEYFRQALGGSGRVVAANSDPLTDGMWLADRAITVPPVHDPHYIEALLEIVRLERISLVVSLFDVDLPFLAAARDRFVAAGATLAVSSPEVIEIANDKWQTHRFLAENGFTGSRNWLTVDEAQTAIGRAEVNWPLYVKPRWGMGSIGVQPVDDIESLRFFERHIRQLIERSYLTVLGERAGPGQCEQAVIIQEGLAGQEYGIDIFNDFDRRPVAVVVKRKLRMRAGETDISEIVDEPRLTELGWRIGRVLGHVGNLDVDVIDDGVRAGVLEFNARFGGGYPFSHLGGANYPELLLQLARGESPRPRQAATGVVGLKALTPMRAPQLSPSSVDCRE